MKTFKFKFQICAYPDQVHAFLSSLPSVGLHALKTRDGVSAGEKDKLAFLASQVRHTWCLRRGEAACLHPPTGVEFDLVVCVCVSVVCPSAPNPLASHTQDNTCKSLAAAAADFQVAIDVAFLSQV